MEKIGLHCIWPGQAWHWKAGVSNCLVDSLPPDISQDDDKLVRRKHDDREEISVYLQNLNCFEQLIVRFRSSTDSVAPLFSSSLNQVHKMNLGLSFISVILGHGFS